MTSGLYAGLLRQTDTGLVEVAGRGYARIPAAEITEALDERGGPGDGVFRWPGEAGAWRPGPPTHVGVFTDLTAGEARTAIPLPAGAGPQEGPLELQVDELRRLLVGA